jgi:hypothetical protein
MLEAEFPPVLSLCSQQHRCPEAQASSGPLLAGQLEPQGPVVLWKQLSGDLLGNLQRTSGVRDTEEDPESL